MLAWASCDLRPPAPPEPVPELEELCVDGSPGRLVVERAGQRIMDIPASELANVRGAQTPVEGRYRGRLLVPLASLGAGKLEVVPCEGDPVHIGVTGRHSLMSNKRGELKLVTTDGSGEPLVKNIALLRVLE